MSTTSISKHHMPFTVGLTGGLASGKSTVLSFFNKLNIDTLSADVVVHQLMHPQGRAYSNIVEHFGTKILNDQREIDRSQLRHLIFQQPEEKHWLEQCLHPMVRTELLEQAKHAHSPYVVIEIPLLAESSDAYAWLDSILVVDVDEKTQQQRAMQRSNLSLAETERIIHQQSSRQVRQSLANDIILNNNDLKQLELEVKQLHNKYLVSSKDSLKHWHLR